MTILFGVLKLNGEPISPSLAKSGWLTYAPRLIYEFIVVALAQMEEGVRDLQLDEGVNVDGIMCPLLRLFPYSLEEFNAVFADEYCNVLTNGDPSKRAIVFHTTPTRRRRSNFLGWYHLFDPKLRSIPVGPDPVQIAEQATPKHPNKFWPVICLVSMDVSVVLADHSTRDVRVEMSVGHIIVGKMMLVAHDEMKKTNNYQKNISGPKSTLDAALVRTMHGLTISNGVKMNDLWPDFRKFREYVKNCWNKTLNLPSYPFSGDGFKEDDRLKFLARYLLCKNYQIETIDDGLDDSLKDSIMSALEGRDLDTILQNSMKGLNFHMASFLLSMQHEYYLECNRRCNHPTEKVTSTSVAQDLHTKWRSSPLPNVLF